ncbi:nitrite reductase, partial [Arthrobacter deserti]|nr:nitrite reductase [Arthrobacter deserti]
IGGRHRLTAAMSGVALLGASALTRFGILRAGIRSAENPRYTIEPQKNRLAARRRAGVVHVPITTTE